jgi:hypothetical protein
MCHDWNAVARFLETHLCKQHLARGYEVVIKASKLAHEYVLLQVPLIRSYLQQEFNTEIGHSINNLFLRWISNMRIPVIATTALVVLLHSSSHMYRFQHRGEKLLKQSSVSFSSPSFCLPPSDPTLSLLRNYFKYRQFYILHPCSYHWIFFFYFQVKFYPSTYFFVPMPSICCISLYLPSETGLRTRNSPCSALRLVDITVSWTYVRPPLIDWLPWRCRQKVSSKLCRLACVSN